MKYRIIWRQRLDQEVIIYLVKATAYLFFSEATQNTYYYHRVQRLGEKSHAFINIVNEEKITVSMTHSCFHSRSIVETYQ